MSQQQTVESVSKRLEEVSIAIARVRTSANQDRKISGEKVMNGHYAKALQELIAIEVQLEKLLERVKVQEK